MKTKVILICDEVLGLQFFNPKARTLALKKIFHHKLIDYQLFNFAKDGVKEVIIVSGNEIDEIEEHIGNGDAWGLELEFVKVSFSLISDYSEQIEEYLKTHFSDSDWIIRLSDMLFLNSDPVEPTPSSFHNGLINGGLNILESNPQYVVEQPGVYVGVNVKIGENVNFNPPVWIANDTKIENNVTLGPNVIIDKLCVIDEGSTIQDSTIIENTYVGKNVTLSHSWVSGSKLANFSTNKFKTIGDDLVISPILKDDFLIILRESFRSLVAGILFLLCIPINMLAILCGLLFGKLPVLKMVDAVIGRDRSNEKIRTRKILTIDNVPDFVSKSFLLKDVFLGKLHFFGNPILDLNKYDRFDSDFEKMWIDIKPGVFTYSESLGCSPEDIESSSPHCSFYSLYKGHKLNFQLMINYFNRFSKTSFNIL